MKLSEFKPAKSAAPVSPRAANSEPDAVASAPQEPQGTSCVTPSGIEIAYEWAPRRLYRLRDPNNADGDDWFEVPSVTTVLGVLDKSGPLTWWGMKVGIEGVRELHRRGLWGPLIGPEVPNWYSLDDVQPIVDLLTEHKLTVNHVKDKAANRGVNVHGALEDWCADRTLPDPANWPEAEQGYVAGLRDFLATINDIAADVEAEVMVGSLEHQFAGRYDLHLRLSQDIDLVTKVYPKRPPRIETIPAGWHRWDLKTRVKPNVYDTNYLQLEGYEAAAVECGYPASDYRGVIVVTEDGRYQLSLNKDWCFEDFLAVRKVYQVMNEREVLRILREDLDAQDRDS